jgi:hypothetical protein
MPSLFDRLHLGSRFSSIIDKMDDMFEHNSSTNGQPGNFSSFSSSTISYSNGSGQPVVIEKTKTVRTGHNGVWYLSNL